MYCCTYNGIGVCGRQKWLQFGFRFSFAFPVRFRFHKINHGFRFSVHFFCTVCCLMCMHSTRCWIDPTNCQMKWLRTRSAVIWHEENTLTVDPIMLEDELWMRQHEKPSLNRRSRFFENWTAETEFSVFAFWGQFGSVPFLQWNVTQPA